MTEVQKARPVHAECNGVVEGQPIRSGIINGWFSEWIEVPCGGHSMCLKIDDVLYHDQSQYQDILIFKSESYGNVLVLDGIINCTERDECAYQEMLTNIAICSHPDPQSVLIIGGGDGGVAREVARHPGIRRVVQCEIDGKVIDACKKFIPSMAVGFDSPRVQLIVGDGFAFIDEHVDEFDVIITDSSDPIGPAEVLFKKEYFERLHRALKPNGIVISQLGESMWIPVGVDYARNLMTDLKTIYPVVNYAYTFVPTYTNGQLGLIMASRNPATRFEEPLRVLSEEELTDMQLKYYNPDMHRSAFVLPQFVRKALQR